MGQVYMWEQILSFQSRPLSKKGPDVQGEKQKLSPLYKIVENLPGVFSPLKHALFD